MHLSRVKGLSFIEAGGRGRPRGICRVTTAAAASIHDSKLHFRRIKPDSLHLPTRPGYEITTLGN